jgi:hypothetical protein
VNIDEGTFTRKASMNEPRQATTVVYRDNHIIALGWKYSYKTCEIYNLETDQWGRFPNMSMGRYNATACLFRNDEYLFVSGGYPVENVGVFIERYNFALQRW